jgi:hypothetical protein
VGRVLGPHRGRHRNLDHIASLQCLQLVEKVPIAAIGLVGRDPVQMNLTQDLGAPDHRGGNLGLGLGANRLGNMGLGPTFPGGFVVLAPRLRQVQLMIQQRAAAGRHSHQEDPDLAVVFLAQAAVVLPIDAGTVVALLGEATLVDHADDAHRRVRHGGGQLLGENLLDLELDIGVIPRRTVDELLQGRDPTIAHMKGDGLDALVFGLGKDHQPFHIGVGMVLGSVLAEEGSEAVVKLGQPLGGGAHVVRGQGVPLRTAG